VNQDVNADGHRSQVNFGQSRSGWCMKQQARSPALRASSSLLLAETHNSQLNVLAFFTLSVFTFLPSSALKP
jgi:hypothetical protein